LLLELEGLEVFAYDSAEAFLQASARGGCVVTDLHMPGVGGLGLLHALGAPSPYLPVILITAAPHAALAEQARALAVFQLLEKPFAPSDLVDAVRRAIAA
jgi:FixJ family two-component response regulator